MVRVHDAGAKGTLASIELDSETEWLNSNQRNEGPERDEKLARIMAKGYDSWKDRPAVLGDDVMLVAACLCPHPDFPMDSSNSAEDVLSFAACGATLGKLPQKPAVAISTLSPKLSRPGHHGLEVMALHMTRRASTCPRSSPPEPHTANGEMTIRRAHDERRIHPR